MNERVDIDPYGQIEVVSSQAGRGVYPNGEPYSIPARPIRICIAQGYVEDAENFSIKEAEELIEYIKAAIALAKERMDGGK